MATEALTRQSAKRSGEQASLQSVTADGGFTFPNDGHTVLYVENTGEGSTDLVFTINETLDGQSATRTVTVASSQNWFIGPFPVELYNDSDDLVTCTPSQNMSNSVAVLSV